MAKINVYDKIVI